MNKYYLIPEITLMKYISITAISRSKLWEIWTNQWRQNEKENNPNPNSEYC